MAIASMLMSCVAATACAAHGDPVPHRKPATLPAAPPPRDPHFDTQCEQRHYCSRFDREYGYLGLGAEISLDDCTVHKGASLSGSWGEHGARLRFQWRAPVPVDGVFPTLSHTVAFLGCAEAHPEVHSPVALIAQNPDGLDWAELEGADIFIPLSGEATVDEAFRATAAIEPTDGGSPLHVTVAVQGPPPAPPAQYRGLGRGDTFPWGDHRVTVIRIMPPQDGELGVIGWVEIDLLGHT
jgi:hypothetical protein